MNPHKMRFKDINSLAIPSIIAGISEPLLSLIDTAIVGNVDTNAIQALAAVGIAGSFIASIVWILGQTRTAISSIIAQYVGMNALEKIKTLPGHVLAINISLGLFLYGLTLFLVHYIFQWYNAEGLILDYAVSYYKIRAIGLPFSLFIFTIYGIFSGLQNTFLPMVISVTGVLVNIVLDVVLVYGIPGYLEGMHVEGAAYASVAAQIIMAAMGLWMYVNKTPFPFFIKAPFHEEIKRIAALSFNLFVRSLSLNVAIYLSNSYATSYGASYIAAQTICFQVWMFFSFFVDGYASVGSIVAGKLKGIGELLSLEILLRDLLKYAVVVAFILSCFCFVFYEDLGLVFTSDPKVLEVLSEVLWLVLITQPLNAIAFVFDGIFKGLAEAVVLRNTVAVATFLGFVPALLISDSFGLKLFSVWIAFTIWMLLRSSILWVYFKRNVHTLLGL